MTTDADTAPVTRREIYAAVAPVWIYLTAVIANSMRTAAGWPDVLLMAGAVAGMVGYLRAAYPRRATRIDRHA